MLPSVLSAACSPEAWGRLRAPRQPRSSPEGRAGCAARPGPRPARVLGCVRRNPGTEGGPRAPHDPPRLGPGLPRKREATFLCLESLMGTH